MDATIISAMTFPNIKEEERQQMQPHVSNPLPFTEAGGLDDSSIFTTEDQSKINGFITSYQDTITHNGLFETLKDYEVEFKQPSSDFYAKWKDGHILSDPKTSEWATIYRVIYGDD